MFVFKVSFSLLSSFYGNYRNKTINSLGILGYVWYIGVRYNMIFCIFENPTNNMIS